jgi:hypothetical protein
LHPDDSLPLSPDITQAAAMQVLDDDMGWLAIVHQQQRGWDRS